MTLDALIACLYFASHKDRKKEREREREVSSFRRYKMNERAFNRQVRRPHIGEREREKRRSKRRKSLSYILNLVRFKVVIVDRFRRASSSFRRARRWRVWVLLFAVGAVALVQRHGVLESLLFCLFYHDDA